jgi:hypothetical protein
MIILSLKISMKGQNPEMKLLLGPLVGKSKLKVADTRKIHFMKMKNEQTLDLVHQEFII